MYNKKKYLPPYDPQATVPVENKNFYCMFLCNYA